MAEFLSPGVFVEEIDASTIAPTVSTSVGVFSGKFKKGPVGQFLLVTSVAELIDLYGQPTNENYNDWYQAYNFLQYGNKLYISRAANLNGELADSGQTVANIGGLTETADLEVQDASVFAVGQILTIDGSEFEVQATDAELDIVTLTAPVTAFIAEGTQIFVANKSGNALAETRVLGAEGPEYTESQLLSVAYTIGNDAQFEDEQMSIPFISNESKLKFIARNPGDWGNNIEIAVATPSRFNQGENAFPGISLDGLFEFAPSENEVGIVIRDGSTIVETFLVDMRETAKDVNGKSLFIEDVINNQSNYVFVKVNDSATGGVASNIDTETVKLVLGSDSPIQADDLAAAYELFDNKESIDIDIVIGNEIDFGVSAKNLVETRQDAIAFIGVEYADVVGKKSADAVAGVVEWRQNGNGNFDSMFVVACGNYKYQYDRYNDKNRWINIAGDIAGLRAETSTNRASWFASAGLERGQIKNVKKLAFNPSQGQRDVLYKNGVNPICTFPGQGTVMWGQKTLLSKPSSFDRVNVRGLFNTLERSLGKMAKYQVMEFNDNFTRNRIVSMIKPFLSSVQAGRGIQDFLVVCDETNNTPDVISRNQLVVDVFIKPTYVAEFIHLKFTNAGTNSFAEVVGG